MLKFYVNWAKIFSILENQILIVSDTNFLLAWAVPESAAHYDSVALRPEDRARAGQARGARAELDWKVSRALLASLPPRWRAASLSHSRGHALCAASAQSARMGVDLERILPRDVESLGHWICSDAERRSWAHMDENSRLERFYLLWTLKEACIKAAGLDFPADMRRVGLAGEPGEPQRLLMPTGSWRANAFRLEPDWMAAVVWEDDGAATAPQWAWHAGPGAALPSFRCLGAWHGQGS